MSKPDRSVEQVLAILFDNERGGRRRRDRHGYITIEHLLLALLDVDEVKRTLIACGIADMGALETTLEDFLRQQDSRKETSDEGPSEVQIRPTIAVQRIFERASIQSAHRGRDEFGSVDVLLAMLSERDCLAVEALRAQGVGRYELTRYLAHGAESEGGERSDVQRASAHPSADAGRSVAGLALNLNEEAAAGRIDPLVGRSDEVERMTQILCRRRKNNPLLVGEAGVGKTAIVEGLARRINEGRVPKPLAGCEIHSLDVGAALAGTRYRGDFEQRLKDLLERFVESDGKLILFIDEIHTIIGAGAASGGAMDAAHMLKPMLSSGRLRCIGATTFREYRAIFERDHALARRFQKIEVKEPSEAESLRILKGLRAGLEAHHGLRYSDGALKAAVELASRHIGDRQLPDKAIDVADEAGARARLSGRRRRVGVGDIEQVVSKIARVPPRQLGGSERDRLRHLESVIKRRVFGQDVAIAELVAAVKLSRAGLREKGRIPGAFLFAGPTGVGKTELCKCLSEALGVELLRFDMSEYQERHTVSRLIGAPPGYVGYQEGGQLTDAVARHPHSVVLLDEIEKAHPEIYNLLLQVMDNGVLTDNNGRGVSFANAYLIMTSNIGAVDAARRSVGFSAQDHRGDALLALEKHFAPEFRNRLDATVLFEALGRDTILTVVDKFVAALQAQLEARKVRLDVTPAARAWLAERGYDERMGARPMQRLIDERLKRPLAENLLFGELRDGGNAAARVDKGELVVTAAEMADA